MDLTFFLNFHFFFFEWTFFFSRCPGLFFSNGPSFSGFSRSFFRTDLTCFWIFTFLFSNGPSLRSMICWGLFDAFLSLLAPLNRSIDSKYPLEVNIYIYIYKYNRMSKLWTTHFNHILGNGVGGWSADSLLFIATVPFCSRRTLNNYIGHHTLDFVTLEN